jgi:hypothetical protein
MDSASEKDIIDGGVTTAAHSGQESRSSKDVKAADTLPRPANAEIEKNRNNEGESSTTIDGVADSGKPANVAPEETRSKGRTALIMTALCVSLTHPTYTSF